MIIQHCLVCMLYFLHVVFLKYISYVHVKPRLMSVQVLGLITYNVFPQVVGAEVGVGDCGVPADKPACICDTAVPYADPGCVPGWVRPGEGTGGGRTHLPH